MVQDACDIQKFFRNLKGLNFFDVIETADAEATAAERRAYRLGIATDGCSQKAYADAIKAFIAYMRYGVKPSGVDPSVFKIYQDIRLHVLDRDRFQSNYTGPHCC